MRLTLRTMLAYLDGILEPEDAQTIGKKIEESAFASDLIHRISDLLRRPSPTVPDATSQGPSLGPNAVAEYLDNTLSPERVTEFEKICLDSDVHLAEVSACHQILTLVLGEPAEIEPASRQRMYDIPAQNSPSTVDETPLSTDMETEMVLPPEPDFSSSSTDVETDRKVRPKPIIPEYLREPTQKNRWLFIATAGVVVICLAVVLLMALGRFEPGTTMGNMLVSLGIVQEKEELAAETSKGVRQPSKTESKTLVKQDASAKTKPQDKIVSAEAKIFSQSSAKTTVITPPADESTKSSDAEQSSVSAAVADKSDALSTSETTAKERTSPAETGAAAPQQTAKTTKQPSDSESPESAAVTSDAKPSEEKTLPPSERLGRYMSEDQILLGNSGGPNDWQRVASKEFLSANQQLLALPTYRPDITLGTVVNLRMLGGTELELLPANARDPAGVKIRFGRIVAMPLANAPAKLRIMTGERTGVLTFVDPEAVVAAEVRRVHAPGSDPETESARLTSEFFITAGHVLWDETGQKTLEIAGPARFTIEDQSPAVLAVAKDFPKWIAAEPIGYSDRRASPTIAQSLLALPADRPAQRGLMELADDRRKEVRWLAVRCLGYLGYFDPMVIVLDDAEIKQQDMADNIDQLCEAIRRDSETAVAVRKTLENRYPQIAADMYRMLWGYSDKDLESGEDEKLVGFLENENLPLRVLSFWNLKEITGKGQYYQPEQTIAKRQQPIQRWKKSLEAKEIRIKSADEKGGNALRENFTQPTGNE